MFYQPQEGPWAGGRRCQFPSGLSVSLIGDVEEVSTAGHAHSFHFMVSRHYNISTGKQMWTDLQMQIARCPQMCGSKLFPQSFFPQLYLLNQEKLVRKRGLIKVEKQKGAYNYFCGSSGSQCLKPYYTQHDGTWN